ncbi:Holliday junction branch migration protein RuvA [Candidatus Kaiserbacteria bacterium]|nr:Holliday junction branch migration protein RuvA [Candidatus Kaiserbacteria bacterium]
MIGSLKGIVRGIIRESIVLEVNSVGYRVGVLLSTLTKAAEGNSLFVWTHLAVRETAQDLYGFETREELQWFELLLTVSGVGPKSALAIMNAVDTISLERAIAKNDAMTLSKSFGIGKKTAEKIVLELREKVGSGSGGKGAESGSDGDVVEALVGLGYSLREARDAVHDLSSELKTPEARLREALRRASHSR